MLKAKIIDAKIEFSLSDNKKFINVTFDVLDGKKVIANRVLGFDLESTQDEILAELDRHCIMIENDIASVEEAEKRSEAEKLANETVEKLIKK